MVHRVSNTIYKGRHCQPHKNSYLGYTSPISEQLQVLQVRFGAFEEKFDVVLSVLSDAVSLGSRIRALGAGGKVLVDRSPRLRTYGGRLQNGGWIRAIVRSSTSVTVHFLHNVSSKPYTSTVVEVLLNMTPSQVVELLNVHSGKVLP